MQKIFKVFLLAFLISCIFSTPSFSQTQEVISYLCEIGMGYYAQAKYDDALQQFKSILLLEPNNKIAKEYSQKILIKKDLAQNEAMGFTTPKKGVSTQDLMNQTLDKYQNKRTASSYQRTTIQSNEKPAAGNILRKESPGDYVVAAKEKIEKEFPVELSGEYRVSFGADSDDFIWKKANADKEGVPHEKNYRYIWGDQRYNTYDEKIYDRLRLDLATKYKGPWNMGTDITIDPWSFLGHGKVTVASTTGNDSVDLDLKYWSNTGKTLNEIYRTDLGNIINLNEIKVVNGKTTPATPFGLTGFGTAFNQVPATNIDRTYRPVRKLFVDYTQANYKFHIFPISDEYEAMTTDDPLRLSNNHVYWEESPWIDSYEASRVFTRPGSPLKTGRWIRRWSYVAKDSSDDYPHYLTFLRGASFSGNLGPVTLEAVSAAPLDFWNEYQEANTMENALRLKYPWSEDLNFGLTYTNKMGLVGGGLEAVNNLYAGDAKFHISPYTNIFAEFAGSTFNVDEANGMKTSLDGLAGSVGMDFKEPKEMQKGFYRGRIYLSYLNKDFYPGLTNYRFTRRDDPYWARSVFFGELSPDDEALVWGDGTDRGRISLGFNTAVKSFEDRWDTRLDLRDVRSDSGGYIETVSRLESTAKWGQKLTSKVLFYYQHLPKTQQGIDPLIYDKTIYNITDFFSEDDEHPLNSSVEGGEDPSVAWIGLGLKYDLTNALSLEGIFDRTNDPLDFPRSLLNDFFVTNEINDGVVYDKVVPFLYDQSFFGSPPYSYYNIYKAKFIWQPVINKLKLTLSYTKNENKFATGVDDNVNHIGFETDYNFNKKWNFWMKYTYSQIVDLYRLVVNNDFLFKGHNNFFFGARYNFREDESFTLLFGEFVGYDNTYLDSNWTLSTADTQHLFRVFYKKSF